MSVSKTVEEYRPPGQGEQLILPEHLLSRGEDAVPLLCELLESPKLRIRILAARKLKEVGDERAVQPLCRMLDEYSGPVSPWVSGIGRLTAVGVLAVLTSLITLAVVVAMLWSLTLYRGALFTIVMYVVGIAVFIRDLFNARPLERLSNRWRDTVASFSGHELFVRAAVDAIAAIAERCPGTSLQQSLPALRRVSADGVRHQRPTREAATRAAARVRMSSTAVRRLPIACPPAAPSAQSLPLPAGSPTQE
jgi:hypothetical protein